MKHQKEAFRDLKQRWEGMLGMSHRPQERGRQFDSWLRDLFQASGLKAEGPFTRKAPDEELDGFIQEGLTTFLLEAKWEKDSISATHVDRLESKIRRSTIGSYGILISISGFNDNAIQTIQEIKPIRQFLIDVQHIEALLEQKIAGKEWLNTLVKFASLYAKPFISIKDILNENEISSLYLTPENPNQYGANSNPFQTVGTLSADAPSYIKRECDSELAKMIESNKKKLIAIHGGFEIGKSSLMIRIMHTPFLANSNWIRCHLDMQPLFPSDMEYFENYFFKHLNSWLNSKINSWKEMDSFLIDQPLVLCIEEFGKFIDYQKAAKSFIQNLCIRAQNSDNIRIVVESILPIEDFFDQFPGQDFEHPKYRRCWENIAIKPFNEAQAKQLFSLLPESASKMAMENIDTIKERSSFKPRPLQCLCDHLFDAVNETAAGSKLIDIIGTEKSYS